MNPYLALILSFGLAACNAYRTSPQSEVLFTKAELGKGGLLLAPVTAESGSELEADELAAADSTLMVALEESWPKVQTLSPVKLSGWDVEKLEAWRSDLQREDLSTTDKLLSGVPVGSVPQQILIPRVISNVVSCGQKDAMVTSQNPNPKAIRAYCQRLMKMRFRIVRSRDQVTLWNGIVYATQENALPLSKVQEGEAVEAPTTQALLRDCIHNFARQFADR